LGIVLYNARNNDSGFPYPDPGFVPESQIATYPHIEDIGAPTTAVAGPVIGIDSTHQNRYTINPTCPRYAAFQQLLTADGATVVDFANRWSSTIPGSNAAYVETLSALDILVIVEPDPASISSGEADYLRRWVRGDVLCPTGHCENRGLIVVSTQAQPNLSAALGVSWDSAADSGREFTKCGGPRPSTTELYGPGTLIADHPVTRGFVSSEWVESVKTFAHEQKFCYGDYCYYWAGVNYNGVVDIPTAISATSFLTHPDGTHSAGLAFQLGSGRVYAGSDPDMFTAVIAAPIVTYYAIIDIPAVDVTPPAPIGMQVHPPNQQFLLNVVHWMDGILADGDGVTDDSGLCRWEPPPVWPYTN
jgi:hypothetical protein